MQHMKNLSPKYRSLGVPKGQAFHCKSSSPQCLLGTAGFPLQPAASKVRSLTQIQSKPFIPMRFCSRLIIVHLKENP